jgi:site-specific recombinase XerD
MTLDEAVRDYLIYRRSEGSQGTGTQAVLLALCRQVGKQELIDIHPNQISAFINNPQTLSVTRISKFSVVRCFFDHFAVRQYIPFLSIEKPPRTIIPRYPLIYTRNQIRSLLSATDKCNMRSEGLDGTTFRMIILVLYATGMTVREVVTLRYPAVDLKARNLRLDGTFSRPARNLAIGTDLRAELKIYKDRMKRRNDCGPFFFHKLEGESIRPQNLRERFEWLCRTAEVGVSPQGHLPRLTDLRYTFAVHRITSWVRQGLNLNSLLPALSTYMGYSNLTKAEQFLNYVPERFKDDLGKLTSVTKSRHWKNESELMKYLSSL